MSKLDWGSSRALLYEHGVDRGVFYTQDGIGVPWNGLVSVKEDHSTPKEVIRYYDGKQYRSQISVGDFSAVVECYTYPPELDNYEYINFGLSAHSRRDNTYFNFSYRTLTDAGYKIHLVYNAMAKSSNKSYSSVGNSSDPVNFSWDVVTIPVAIPGAKHSAHIVVDSTVAYPWVVHALEEILYGGDSNEPRFPTVDELVSIFEAGSILRVTDHGDGSVTVDGPDDIVKKVGTDLWMIGEWPSVVQLDTHIYRLSSL